MSFITTVAASNITSTSARLNGIVEGIDYQCGFDGDVGYIDTGSQGGVFYYDISGLTPGVTYAFHAWANDGVDVISGSTLSFHTPGTVNKSIGGTLSFGGGLSTYRTHTPVNTPLPLDGTLKFGGGLVKQTGKELSGELSFGGALGAGLVIVQDLDGTLSFGGELTTAGVTFTKDDLAGTLSFGGDLTPSETAKKSLDGTLRFSGTLASFRTIATPTGARDVAGTLNLYIEQGTTYVKVFEWRDSTGVARNISSGAWSLRMVIKEYKGASTNIATSATTIIITKLVSTGQFQISIAASVTDDFTFTRAFYDIEAVYGNEVYRLVEGIVYLSKEVTTIG